MKFFFILVIIPSFLLAISTQNQVTSRYEENRYLPWFTGPLLAGAGHTCPQGHYVLEPYLYILNSSSFYNSSWQATRDGTISTVSPSILAVVGITSWMDIQLGSAMDANFKHGYQDFRISDCYVYLGFQALEDKKGGWMPDLRILVKQDFPSGHYKNLNPDQQGVDATGSGYYKTGIAFNFQKLFYVSQSLLQARFNFNYKVSPGVYLSGFTRFAEDKKTYGKIAPQHFFTADFAFEYLLSQNIALACDLYYEFHSFGKFKPDPDQDQGFKGSLQHQRISLAPALEYNFSSDVGIIAGCWFTLAGKNAQNFSTLVIALNYYH